MTSHIKRIGLSKEERSKLEEIIRRPKSPQGLVSRAKIILMTAYGMSVEQIQNALGVTRATISKWKHRYNQQGIKGLADSSRPGQPAKYDSDTTTIILREVLRLRQKTAKCSIRMLSSKLGLNRGIIARVLKNHETLLKKTDAKTPAPSRRKPLDPRENADAFSAPR